jgi:DNA-binding NtrC family response regulator
MARILVVENEPDFLVVMETILQRAGHEVDKAGGNDEAQALLDDGAVFGCAVVDFWLTRSTAGSLLERLTAEGMHVPVIVVSGGGHGMSPQITKALADTSGSLRFLQKPFHADDLLAMVEAALNGDD